MMLTLLLIWSRQIVNKKQCLRRYFASLVFFIFVAKNKVVYLSFYLISGRRKIPVPLTLILPQIFLYSVEEDFSGDLLDAA